MHVDSITARDKNIVVYVKIGIEISNTFKSYLEQIYSWKTINYTYDSILPVVTSLLCHQYATIK